MLRRLLAKLRGSGPDDRPTYMRAWFVLGAVTVAVLLGLFTMEVVVGDDSEPRDVTEADESGVDVEAQATPQSTDPDDCPDPGMAIPFDAAEVLTLLQTAAADPTVGEIPATNQVQEQIEATDPSPPLGRMTRVRGFGGDSTSVSTCVISYWTGATGLMQSLDVVTVAEDDGEWEVTRWLRGVPQPQARTRAAEIAFYGGSRCSRPDRMVSVPVPDGTPSERLRSALEELISGTAGRSRSVSSSVPADIQVVSAVVDGPRATVELTPTSDDGITRCEGTAAHDQIEATAEGIVAESLAADRGGNPGEGDVEVDVEVVVEGRTVDSLRG